MYKRVKTLWLNLKEVYKIEYIHYESMLVSWTIEKSKIFDHVLLAPCTSTKNKPKTSGKNLTRRKMAKIFDKTICKS